MKICHVCKTECEDNAELCPVCGAVLREISEEKAETEEKTVKNPTILATLEDVVSAEIFMDILKENGIPYTCDGDENTVMQVTFGGGFAAQEIYVDEADLETAKTLYSEFLESEAQMEEQFLFDDGEEFEDEEDI